MLFSDRFFLVVDVVCNTKFPNIGCQIAAKLRLNFAWIIILTNSVTYLLEFLGIWGILTLNCLLSVKSMEKISS